MGAITRSISNNLTTGLGAGLVKQVVTATNSTQNNVASTSFTDTNLTANITPSATSSKILVMVQQQIVADRDNEDAYSALRLLRASTVLETFDKAQWDEAGGVGAVKAGKNYYPVSKMITSEAGIFHEWFRDIYFILGDQKNNIWFIKVYINPFVSFIWLGVIIMILSGLIGATKR